MFLGIKSKTKVNSKCVLSSSDYNFSEVGKAMEWFVQNGEETSTQLCIFKEGKEIFNFYASTNENIDETSLYPIFSNTKTFSALLIAKCIEMGWIKSYNDLVTDYWP